METTKNKMPPYAENFFDRLKKYLDTKIYFFGSIQRKDYFYNSSDIDADIFTDNEPSTIMKLQNFLNVDRNQIHKFVYKLHKTNKVVYGYKVKYTEPSHNFSTEISIYNEKYKKDVLIEHKSKMNLPFYILYLLILLKTIYYNLGIMPTQMYYVFKKLVMNYMVEGQDVEFTRTDLPNIKIVE